LQFYLWTKAKGSTIDLSAEFIAIQIINHGLIYSPAIVAVIHGVETFPFFHLIEYGFMVRTPCTSIHTYVHIAPER